MSTSDERVVEELTMIRKCLWEICSCLRDMSGRSKEDRFDARDGD